MSGFLDERKSNDFELPQASVRGHTALDEPARSWTRIAAAGTDGTLALSGWCLMIKWLGLSPLPGIGYSSAYIILAIIVGVVAQRYAGATPGQALWKLRILSSDKRPVKHFRKWYQSKVYQHEALGGSNPFATLVTLTLTTICVVSTASLVRSNLLHHPLLAQANTWELQPFAPPVGQGLTPSGSAWAVIPFFYSIGAWPITFDKQPVLYSLPYEKGPPSRFVGHIVARWNMPEVKLTIEGPRTADPDLKISDFRKCMTSVWGPSSPKCLRSRARALDKHLEEIQKIRPTHWEVRWFSVRNPAVLEEEQPQGIYISATNSTQAQERFVFINSHGTEQTFVLDRPLGPKGDSAREVFEQAVRSQRVSTELYAGRAWVDNQLLLTGLGELDKISDPQKMVARLAQIEGLLISKISVDPKSYDAYYHLGGVSFLLARHALKEHNLDWSAIAKPMIGSAYRYAQDLSPKDQRTAELLNIWLEVKKL